MLPITSVQKYLDEVLYLIAYQNLKIFNKFYLYLIHNKLWPGLSDLFYHLHNINLLLFVDHIKQDGSSNVQPCLIYPITEERKFMDLIYQLKNLLKTTADHCITPLQI